MSQPELGLKVAELRQEKGLTQEQLAELCEVSARAIQRIESGEVDPRLYTLNCLSQALDFDFGEENTANENLWLALLHLNSMICNVILPLLLWSWKKNQSFKIDKQGRQVFNFQITMTLTLFAAVFLAAIGAASLPLLEGAGLNVADDSPIFIMLVLCIPALLILTGIFCAYQGVVNAMRALSDKPIYYALTIPFVK